MTLCEEVATLSKHLDLEKNLILQRKDLSEVERVKAYNAADAIIFPYVGPEPEQLADPPFGILESMACGRIVVSTRVLSVPEIVKDESTGFLTGSASKDDLYNGIVRALTHSDRSAVGLRAREMMVEEFSYPVVRHDLLETYESVLAR